MLTADPCTALTPRLNESPNVIRYTYLMAAIPPDVLAIAILVAPMLCAILIGMLKCLLVSRRPMTHRWCVFALFCCFVGWFLAFVGTALASLDRQNGLIPLIIVGSLIVSVPCFMLSIVLGIIGLCDFNHNPDQFNQGRNQAKTAIVFSAIPLFFVLFVAFRESRNSVPSPESSTLRSSTFCALGYI